MRGNSIYLIFRMTTELRLPMRIFKRIHDYDYFQRGRWIYGKESVRNNEGMRWAVCYVTVLRFQGWAFLFPLGCCKPTLRLCNYWVEQNPEGQVSYRDDHCSQVSLPLVLNFWGFFAPRGLSSVRGRIHFNSLGCWDQGKYSNSSLNIVNRFLELRQNNI